MFFVDCFVNNSPLCWSGTELRTLREYFNNKLVTVIIISVGILVGHLDFHGYTYFNY